MLHQRNQPVSIDQRAGLQELPQLVHLDAVIHLLQPLLRVLHRFSIWRIDRLVQPGTGRGVNYKLARQFRVNGM